MLEVLEKAAVCKRRLHPWDGGGRKTGRRTGSGVRGRESAERDKYLHPVVAARGARGEINKKLPALRTKRTLMAGVSQRR